MIGVERMNISHGLVRRIADIDEFRGLWRGIDDHTTGLKLIGDVAQHHDAFHQVLEALHDKPLTLKMISTLHQVISGGKSGAGILRDEYHRLPVMKGSEVVGYLETAAPEDISPLMDKLLEWVNGALDEVDEVDEADSVHPLIIIGVFFGVFLQISPFQGRNMRLARFLTIILMMKAGYGYAPYSLLDPVMEDRGREVLVALQHNQRSLEAGNPDWSVWLLCFTRLLQSQKDVLYQRLYGDDAVISVQDMPALSIALLEHIRASENGRMTMKEAIAATNGRRSTIKLRLHELVGAGLIHRYGAGRGVWYSLV